MPDAIRGRKSVRPHNSDRKAEVVFVNIRPGRKGAGKSGFISFYNNDPSAEFFKECFELTGLDRRKVFITNACLCYPDYENYKDKNPKVSEMKNCHFWLERQLEIADPALVVTVGKHPLESVLRYFVLWENWKREKFTEIAGKPITETNPWIFPVCHTSALGRVNRHAELQREDWRKILEILKEVALATNI